MSPKEMQLPESLDSLKEQLSELKSKISPNQLYWLITTTLLAGTLVIGMVGIHSPWQERRRRLNQQVQEEMQRSDLLASILQLRRTIQIESKDIFFAGGTAVLTSRVSRLAAASGVKIDSVLPKSDRSLGPYTNHQIQITATASFQELLRFLNALENHRPLFRVDLLDISQPDQMMRSQGVLNTAPRLLPGFEETQEQKTKLLISAFNRRRESP